MRENGMWDLGDGIIAHAQGNNPEKKSAVTTIVSSATEIQPNDDEKPAVSKARYAGVEIAVLNHDQQADSR